MRYINPRFTYLLSYLLWIRGKKWWWPIFTWILDTALHNAWILAKGAGSNMPQLEFRRLVAQTYLQRYGTMPKSAGRPSTSKASSLRDSRVSDDISFDAYRYSWDGKRRRCAGGNCLSVVRTECQKCGVGLCIPCSCHSVHSKHSQCRKVSFLSDFTTWW